MTLTFNPEIWFKVTENPLPKGNMCVKFKLCWAREKESVPGPDILDGRTDRLITTGRPQSGVLKGESKFCKKQSNHVVFTVNVDIS